MLAHHEFLWHSMPALGLLAYFALYIRCLVRTRSRR